LASNDKVIIAGIAIVVVLAIIAIIGAACCACVLCVSTSSWHWGEWGGYSATTEHREDTTVHAGAPNIELYVDTFNGNIVVQESATTTDVTVTYDVFYPQGRMSDVQTGTRSDNVNNDTVRITAEAKRNPSDIILTGNYGAHVTILVPKNSSYVLRLNTLNCDVRVAPLHGESVIMNSKNGDVTLNGGSYGSIRLETYNGAAEATGSYESTNATLITRNGRIVADTLQTTGTLYADTWNGRVDVTLPRDTLFTVDASTWNGRVSHNSIQLNTTVDRSNELKGTTSGGAGNLTVTLRTRNGEINIGY
jgi:hypothetical protein